MLTPVYRLRFLLLTATALTSPAYAQQLPTGASIVSGEIGISAPGAAAMRIDQSTDRAIINWQGFSIGAGSRVDIVQPGAKSALLNRVTGDTPTTISGTLNANGQVAIVNPNGIGITEGGTVNTNGFIGSTLDIGNDDFLAGKLNFAGNGSSASVSNRGTINIGQGGYAALIGGRVSNAGIISAPMGKVGLGAGERVTLDLSGDGFLQVALPSSATDDGGALVSNSGRISARGGRIEMSAAAARNAARNVINMSGVTEATTVSGRSGAIVLSGGGGGVHVSGKLNVAAAAPPVREIAPIPAPRLDRGGSVTVTGSAIRLAGASIDASGPGGGGNVSIGGGARGLGALPHADLVSVDADTTITADATRAGNGGTVVLWSDSSSDFAGNISARGIGATGAGGFVEVSGGTLSYTGRTDLRSDAGRFGTLLLDPTDITIADEGSDVLLTSDLEGQLELGNVTVSTPATGDQEGNITVLDNVQWNEATTLTLAALNNIDILSPITGSSEGGAFGGLVLSAQGDITIGPVLIEAGPRGITANAANSILISGGAELDASGGRVDLTAGGNIEPPTGDEGGSIGIFGDSGVSLSAGGTIELNGFSSVESANGNVALISDGAIDLGNFFNLTAGGSALIDSGGTLTVGIEPDIVGNAGLTIDAETGIVILDEEEFGSESSPPELTSSGTVSLATRGSIDLGNVPIIVASGTGPTRLTATGTISIPEGSDIYGGAGLQINAGGGISFVPNIITGTQTTELETGSVVGPGGSIVLSTNGAIDFGGLPVEFIADNGDVQLLSNGVVTLTPGSSFSASGNFIVSSTEFHNNTGAGAFDIGGRALVYSTNWTEDTRGNLAGTSLYGRTFAANPPGTIPGTGNVFIYSDQPVLTVVVDDGARRYFGTLPNTVGFVVQPGGLVNGDTLAVATDGGTVVDTSPLNAGVGTLEGVLTVAGLTSDIGYLFNIQAGDLTVTPAPLTISADDLAKLLGQQLTFNGTEFAITNGQLFGGDSVNLVSLASEGAFAGATIGLYDILQNGISGTGLENYDITFVAGDLFVAPSTAFIGRSPLIPGIILASNPTLNNPTDVLPGGLTPEITEESARFSLQILENRTADFTAALAQCDALSVTQDDAAATSEYLSCLGDALEGYANQLNDALIKLPPELQATSSVIARTVQEIRAVAVSGLPPRQAIARAQVAVRQLVDFVNSQTELVRAVDPETEAILKEHGNVIAGALEQVDLSLASAVEL